MRVFGCISKLMRWLGSDKFFWRTAGILFLIGIVGAIVSYIAPAKPEADTAATKDAEPSSKPMRSTSAKADTARPLRGRKAEVTTETAASLPLTPS